ncbi:GAF domain-containing protein [Profundibacterium mesophilum]|uniref:histidine kinase n=1 Tax=Profundibacterium mesophilum KAUST100406-0324 TaxID=1037889 RepID=A0A921NTL5_9RHOB|nr:GAF domain-containing protein [Profundibacterium mesophilum]KAF0675303.1 two-component system chemotaxis family sensor kinase Cph1 [Profundibacterium mesophilum KAUST100406-0324]
MADDMLRIENDPLDICASEQIQFMGRVQSYGCLLVINNSWIVQNASENTYDILGLKAEGLIGMRLIEQLSPEAMHTLRGKVQTLSGGDESVRVFGVDLFNDGRRFDAAMHRSGLNYLLEFERKSNPAQRDDLSLVEPLMAKVRAADSVEEMCKIAARGLWALTGFSRVMAYRFEADHSGRVIAEMASANMDRYLGLAFPAGDIPPQARALYKRNLLRIIPDITAPSSPIRPACDPQGQPVDLSMAVTRAVSPIHIEYLANMGVRASMSVSIMRNGELWGMMACHHPQPLYIDYETRSAIELFIQLLSYELTIHEDRLEREHAEKANALHDRLVMLFEAGLDFTTGLNALSQEIATVVEFDGIALRNNDRYHHDGLAPSEEEFRRIETQLSAMPAGRLITSSRIDSLMPGALDPDSGIAGLMALPIRRHPRQAVVLFRREVTQNVVWAGKPAGKDDPEKRISPRQSFQAWQETVRRTSAEWSAGEKRAGEVLRVTLLELILKIASDSSRAGRARNQRQEVLISELNHRMRNVFGLIEGIVSDGRGDPALDPHINSIIGRIRSLARANDQLTGSNSGPFSLCALIRNEAEAFGGSNGTMHFGALDLHLAAELRPTMALVMHELVTNSVKYGALGARGGIVQVDISKKAKGAAAEIVWSERGGPPVGEPDRVGFGTTLITRSIPHELGGTAILEYHISGLEARFTLPSNRIEAFVPMRPTAGAKLVDVGTEEAGPDTARLLSGHALVVEDNLIIAMNAADALRALGAETVLTAGNVAQALELLEENEITLGLLDIDLASENSSAVAAALKERGIPFLLATGYEGARIEDPAYAGAPLLSKPYSNEAIAAHLATL